MFFRKANKEVCVSFEELLDTDEDTSGRISDILGTEKDEVEKTVEKDIDKEQLQKTIGKLTKFEQDIILLRFGLNGLREHTQKEVAKKLEISQSYISKLEKKILSRLGKEINRFN